ncbi:hypothetical protein MTBBW1_10065 [Desulfamplus magnetovallimortis]|uniref:Uncharacterized protein n=1 Tax=Desulfamplus magnetovallimortis TaxID=1246637 RepID=A0A1W1H4M6_9BACT|nr:hypothetical protein MTBBW1_10065 [Desulfamplus magnetovallimortis]
MYHLSVKKMDIKKFKGGVYLLKFSNQANLIDFICSIKP